MVHPYMRQEKNMGKDDTIDSISQNVIAMLDRLHVIVVGPGLGRDPVLHLSLTPTDFTWLRLVRIWSTDTRTAFSHPTLSNSAAWRRARTSMSKLRRRTSCVLSWPTLSVV
jgi:hypothetical protein